MKTLGRQIFLYLLVWTALFSGLAEAAGRRRVHAPYDPGTGAVGYVARHEADQLELARLDDTTRRTLIATARLNDQHTAFYLGDHKGEALMLTSSQALPMAQACQSVDFIMLGDESKCLRFLGSWPDLGISLFTAEFRSKYAMELLDLSRLELQLEPLAGDSAELVVAGHGLFRNSSRLLTWARCSMVAGGHADRLIADPQPDPGLRSPRALPSLALNCPVSPGDWGAPVVEVASGKAIGLVWTHGDFRGGDAWTNFSYAVPAWRLKAVLEPYLNELGVVPRSESKLRENVRDWKGSWASSQSEVSREYCRPEDTVTEEAMREWLDLLYTGKPTDGRVRGLQFQGEDPLLLGAFKALVSDRPAREIKRAAGHCRSVICATRELFGDGVNIRLLYLFAKFGVNASPYAKFWDKDEQQRHWNLDELDDVIQVLYRLPRKITRQLGAMDIKRVIGFTPTANAVIELFDPYFEESRAARKYTIIHELAHKLDAMGCDVYRAHNPAKACEALSVTAEWMALSGGWKIERVSEGFIETAKPQNHLANVSIYSEKNPTEDFAESVAGYRYSPERLRKASAAKYDFIRQYVFAGQEFAPRTEEQCLAPVDAIQPLRIPH